MAGLEGKELGSLDFDALIGGPLVACVNGQVQSNLATINFVKTMGFEQAPYADVTGIQSTGKPAYINFTYNKTLADGRTVAAKLQVPFLTMIPIPTLRIQTMSVELLCKINSVVAKSATTALGLGLEAAGNAQFLVGSVGLKVSAVFQRQTNEGHQVTRDYSLSVRIKAVQDELPPGLDRVLSVLEAEIREVDKFGRPFVAKQPTKTAPAAAPAPAADASATPAPPPA